MSRELMRQYINLKLARNLSDIEIAKRLGISRDKLIRYKKTWELPLRKQKDNFNGVSEMDFQRGAKIGLSRKVILMRVRDYYWSVEKAVTEPLDKSKSHKRGGNKNEVK